MSAIATKPIERVERGGGNRSLAVTNLVAGGGAGIMEAITCHPLDTVKVRMQLLRKSRISPLQVDQLGFLSTFARIVRTEGFFALYRGFDAVFAGMGPKMAVRFTSFEGYKSLLAGSGEVKGSSIFLAGLAAGITEAVCVVNPMEVVKIRIQGAGLRAPAPVLDGSMQMHVPQYRNAFQVMGTVALNEGVGALYRGVTLTALRQGTNQAANFTVYSMLKKALVERQARQPGRRRDIPGYQTALIGLFSGAMGPLCNAPIDTVKTRLQNSTRLTGESASRKIFGIISTTLRTEGATAFYSGLTPRIIRVAPGQAVTFTAYESFKKMM